VLAQRTLAEERGDEARMQRLFRRCTARRAEPGELALLLEALRGFRERYDGAPEDAAMLLEVGEAAHATDANLCELAAWTMTANALLNLDATITRS
jgi:hypothetical protein